LIFKIAPFFIKNENSKDEKRAMLRNKNNKKKKTFECKINIKINFNACTDNIYASF